MVALNIYSKGVRFCLRVGVKAHGDRETEAWPTEGWNASK